MKHTSVKLDSPIELINLSPIDNPMFARCQIKVCYVSDKPNRNGSVITKDVAKEMANSLPGCPIVGYYNEQTQDFEEHNRLIDISGGKFEIKDTTRPYGFIPQDAKTWFAKYYDDGMVEHEYLMTEGVLWVGQYPECKRILTNGNNQSMELDEKTLNATWSEDENGMPKFFIINEAIISKLCILGEEHEPCFEGANITSLQFAFDDKFKEQLFTMLDEFKDSVKEGGAKKVFTTFAVQIGDELWTALYSHVDANYANHSIVGVYEDEGQKYAVLQNNDDNKYYRIDFSLSDSNEYIFADSVNDISDSYTVPEVAQFDAEEVATYAKDKKKKDEEDKDAEKKPAEGEKKPEDGEKKPEEGEKKPAEGEEDDEEDKKKKKKKFSYDTLEEIPEYVDLQTKFSELEVKFNDLTAEKENLATANAELITFKQGIERQEKQDMINNQFYMLSEEDKADVIAHIDEYSLDDIEAKLSVICVRNKVSFDSAENESGKGTTFNLQGAMTDDATTPAWVKAALNVAKNMK